MYFTSSTEPVIATICYLKYKYKTACCFSYKIAINEDNVIILIIECEVQLFKDKFLKLVYSFDNWANIQAMAESLLKSVEITDYSIQQVKNNYIRFQEITNL